MFKCGGESVYPAEIEAVLERHPAILQAAVVPASDALKGMVPIAFVVAKPGCVPQEDEIKRFVLAQAAAYLHPRRVIFLPSLPLNGVNKVDRAWLMEQAEPFAPTRSIPAAAPQVR